MSKKRKKRRPRRPAPATVAAKTKEQAPPAKPRRGFMAAADERPPAPWGSFPLVEIAVLVGIVMLLIGLIAGGDRGPLLIGIGLGLAGLGGLELAIREHFAGFRSHSALLAGVPAIAALALLFYTETLAPGARIAVTAAVFGGAFVGLATMFKRKAGVTVKLR
jgi:hypothetical protein